MQTNIRRGLAFALCALGAFSCAHHRQPRSDLIGRWRSERPEPLPGAAGDVNYLIRDFKIDADTWTIDFTVFDDEEMRTPLLQGRNQGRYAVAATPGVDGFRAAEFTFSQRTLSPHAVAFVGALNAGKCGDGNWALGGAQSVFESGCKTARVFSKAECDREYDIVRLDGGKLYLGARPADGFLCSVDRRPFTSGAPLVRADGG